MGNDGSILVFFFFVNFLWRSELGAQRKPRSRPIHFKRDMTPEFADWGSVFLLSSAGHQLSRRSTTEDRKPRGEKLYSAEMEIASVVCGGRTARQLLRQGHPICSGHATSERGINLL